MSHSPPPPSFSVAPPPVVVGRWTLTPTHPQVWRPKRGRYGEVYQARDATTNRTVAVKVDRTLIQPNTKDKEKTELRLALFGYPRHAVREIHLLKQMSSHPNIVKLLDVVTLPRGSFQGTEEEEGALIFEFVDFTLHDRLLKGKLTADRYLLHIAQQLVAVLAYLHGKKVYHRDIKPDNILLTAQYEVKLCDLGLARMVPFHDPVLTSHAFGTSGYRCPEICRQMELPKDEKRLVMYDEGIDTWACGVILAEMYLYASWESLGLPLKERRLMHPAGKESDFDDNIAQLMRQRDIVGSEAWGTPDVEGITVVTTEGMLQRMLEKAVVPVAMCTVITGMLHGDPAKRMTARRAVEILGSPTQSVRF